MAMKTVLSKVQAVGKGPGGVIARMISPGDLGQQLKPFVFLDFLSGQVESGFGFGYHPHSGIATLTYQLTNDIHYTDTEGKEGILPAGGLEWMRAGGGAWHRGSFHTGGHCTAFQLWLTLPPGIEDGPSYSQYVDPSEVPVTGSVKVLLGSYGNAQSPITTPTPVNYLDVSLAVGEPFTYDVPAGHGPAWAFVFEGKANVGGTESSKELLVLSESGEKIQVSAVGGPARMLLATAVAHPHPVLTGYYSVHTNEESLAKGEAKIAQLGDALRQKGLIK